MDRHSPDGSTATVAACTGLALGLLDQWMAGHSVKPPARPLQILLRRKLHLSITSFALGPIRR
jgi:hypothetical protein